MPTYRSGDESPGGADFRRLARDAARHVGREAGFGLAVERGPTTDTFRVAKGRAFWARLTARDGIRYSWQEVWPTPGGGWSDLPESRTGTLDAFERNHDDEIPVGSEGGIAWMEPGEPGDWRFTWNRGGGAPCTARVCITVGNINGTIAPVGGAVVTIGDVFVPTNANGIACFELENGNYEYTVTADGYPDKTGPITVSKCLDQNLIVSFGAPNPGYEIVSCCFQPLPHDGLTASVAGITKIMTWYPLPQVWKARFGIFCTSPALFGAAPCYGWLNMGGATLSGWASVEVELNKGCRMRAATRQNNAGAFSVWPLAVQATQANAEALASLDLGTDSAPVASYNGTPADCELILFSTTTNPICYDSQFPVPTGPNGSVYLAVPAGSTVSVYL